MEGRGRHVGAIDIISAWRMCMSLLVVGGLAAPFGACQLQMRRAALYQINKIKKINQLAGIQDNKKTQT